jgi:integrase
MPLTAAKVNKSKPRMKQYKLADSEGMYLLITPNGSKYWRLKYRFNKKEKTLALGVYPKVSLAEARCKRESAKKELEQGVDPTAKRKQDKQHALLSAENNLEAIAREWHEQKKGEWTEAHAKRVLDSLESEVFSHVGSLPIADIVTQDLLSVLRRVEKRGALDVASRVLQRLNSIFRYGVQTGRIKSNPAIDLKGVLKTRKVQHRPALKANELPGFFTKLDNYQGDPVTIYALRLLMLTFVRPGELRGARWTEFDIKAAEWRIPSERMKMRHEHVVPLSKQAISVIEDLKPLSSRNDLLFPNRNGNGKIMSENTLTYALYRMGYHSRATAHGFRATASTILNEQGWNADVVERQLAHKERNKVRAAYHRAEYLKERIKMMQWWADYLDGIRQSSNVTPIMQNIHN